jgi:hypothetical protein
MSLGVSIDLEGANDFFVLAVNNSRVLSPKKQTHSTCPFTLNSATMGNHDDLRTRRILNLFARFQLPRLQTGVIRSPPPREFFVSDLSSAPISENQDRLFSRAFCWTNIRHPSILSSRSAYFTALHRCHFL